MAKDEVVFNGNKEQEITLDEFANSNGKAWGMALKAELKCEMESKKTFSQWTKELDKLKNKRVTVV